MKVRWTADSIRLRITPTELDALIRNEIVREEVSFGRGEWSARIVPGCAKTDFTFADGALQINLAAHDRARLAQTEAEGVYFDRSDDYPLRLCIEKDFPCVHPRPAEAREPQTETFTAPDNSSLVEV